MKRGLLLGGGAVAFALAVATAFGVSPLGLEPGQLLVQLVGFAALAQAGRVALARRGALHRVETHTPERPQATPPPGERLEDSLSSFASPHAGVRHRPTRLQRGLAAAAVAVLTRFDGYSEEDAEAAVSDGSWTTDPFAASLLGDPDVPAPPLLDRVRTAIGGGSAFDRGVAHTVDELVARARVDAGRRTPGDDGAGGTGVALADDRSSGDAGADLPESVRPTGVSGRRAAADGGEVEVPDGARWETGRWKGIGAVALAAVGAGVLAGRPAALLAGVVGIGFAAFSQSGGPPAPEIAVEREVGDDRPAPGEEVAVTVTVRNEGDRTATDLRVVDGVPPALAVVEGSPRLGTALRPGEAAEFTYEVAARRGVHRFDPTLVVAHDSAGATGRSVLVAADAALTCVPTPSPVDAGPLRRGLTRYAGRQATDDGGSGLEFHATREHRPGDPRNRIDWKRWARTGELSTVEFRTERAARVVIVVDARDSAYCSPGPGFAHAVDRSVDAAGRLFEGLLASGDRVGLAAFAAGDPWLPPGSGAAHRARARRLLGTHEAYSPVPPERPANLGRAGQRLRRRLETGTGIVVLSPMVDDGVARSVRTLAAAGHPVTVLSPDPTAGRTPAQRLARLARAVRLSELRDAGVRVLDWGPEESLDAALRTHGRRWSG